MFKIVQMFAKKNFNIQKFFLNYKKNSGYVSGNRRNQAFNLRLRSPEEF